MLGWKYAVLPPIILYLKIFLKQKDVFYQIKIQFILKAFFILLLFYFTFYFIVFFNVALKCISLFYPFFILFNK